jgi:CTP:molybdopterin cytidylyltransferase MocA
MSTTQTSEETSMTETAQQSAVRWDKDSDGIVVLTLDDPTQSANTMNELYKESMAHLFKFLAHLLHPL